MPVNKQSVVSLMRILNGDHTVRKRRGSSSSDYSEVYEEIMEDFPNLLCGTKYFLESPSVPAFLHASSSWAMENTFFGNLETTFIDQSRVYSWKMFRSFKTTKLHTCTTRIHFFQKAHSGKFLYYNDERSRKRSLRARSESPERLDHPKRRDIFFKLWSYIPEDTGYRESRYTSLTNYSNVNKNDYESQVRKKLCQHALRQPWKYPNCNSSCCPLVRRTKKMNFSNPTEHEKCMKRRLGG